MNLLRAHLSFKAGIIAFLGLLGALVWGWTNLNSQTHELREKILRLQQEKTSLLRNRPTEETARQIQEEQMELDSRNAVFKARLMKKKEAEVDDTLSRTQAYFELATFVDKWRKRAAENQIQLRERECFSFGSYAHTGPEEEEIGDALRQMRILDHLLEILVASRPASIVNVQRSKAGKKSGQTDPGGDYFDPAILLQTEKKEGILLLLVFTGSTQTLKDVLKPLTALDSKILVRDIFVEAIPPTVPSNEAQTIDANIITMVPHVISRFSMTVEYRSWPKEGHL